MAALSNGQSGLLEPENCRPSVNKRGLAAGRVKRKRVQMTSMDRTLSPSPRPLIGAIGSMATLDQTPTCVGPAELQHACKRTNVCDCAGDSCIVPADLHVPELDSCAKIKSCSAADI